MKKFQKLFSCFSKHDKEEPEIERYDKKKEEFQPINKDLIPIINSASDFSIISISNLFERMSDLQDTKSEINEEQTISIYENKIDNSIESASQKLKNIDNELLVSFQIYNEFNTGI
jgi:hypothetical protein